MTDADPNTPIEVRSPRGARTTQILFADGHEALYPHELLRGFCPCATCQGHQGPIEFVEADNLELAEIGEVGNYALLLTWGDGHNTGIYSFTYLRRLCACPVCCTGDPKRRSFER
jgi:prepilin-type processing-associated H-X9-DG protein